MQVILLWSLFTDEEMRAREVSWQSWNLDLCLSGSRSHAHDHAAPGVQLWVSRATLLFWLILKERCRTLLATLLSEFPGTWGLVTFFSKVTWSTQTGVTFTVLGSGFLRFLLHFLLSYQAHSFINTRFPLSSFVILFHQFTRNRSLCYLCLPNISLIFFISNCFLAWQIREKSEFFFQYPWPVIDIKFPHFGPCHLKQSPIHVLPLGEFLIGAACDLLGSLYLKPSSLHGSSLETLDPQSTGPVSSAPSVGPILLSSNLKISNSMLRFKTSPAMIRGDDFNLHSESKPLSSISALILAFYSWASVWALTILCNWESALFFPVLFLPIPRHWNSPMAVALQPSLMLPAQLHLWVLSALFNTPVRKS